MPALDPQNTLVAYVGSVPLYERKAWYEGETGGGWRELTLDQVGVRIAKPGRGLPGTPDKVGIIRIAIRYISQKANKAPIAVRPRVNGEPVEPDRNAELARIWNASRPAKTMHRILTDLWIRGKGNALLRKDRDEATGAVRKLIPVDIKSVTFDRKTGFFRQKDVALTRENYVWITLGSDPEHPELGEDPWDSFGDDLRTLREESTYTADVLQNGGTIGVVISKKDSNDFLGEDLVDRVTKDAAAATTGEKRGSVLVIGSGVDVHELGATPERMALDKLTLGAQSRVAANLQTALMVLGLPDPGKTYSNLAEGKQGTFETAVVGFHDLIAECLGIDLLPDTDGGITNETHEVVWIYDELEEFQEDADAIHERARADVAGGLLTPNEGRAKIGEDLSDQEGADQLQLKTAGPQDPPAGPPPLRI